MRQAFTPAPAEVRESLRVPVVWQFADIDVVVLCGLRAIDKAGIRPAGRRILDDRSLGLALITLKKRL
jgi:hypothetical protein